jgi:hypothetical protein
LSAILRRIESENPGWQAQLGVRAIGLVLLGLCAAAGWWLHRAIHQWPPHGATLLEGGAAVLVAAGWCLGWAFLAEGPGLFRLIPVPDRTLLPFSK